jgi:precorrin-2 dehydrogenase/sirohydrochlorin ferrochelatase
VKPAQELPEEVAVLPIALDPTTMRIGLAGAGEGHKRRHALLAAGGVVAVPVDEHTPLEGISLLFVAGLGRQRAAALARRAQSKGVLVNVEDVPELCNFHVPAIVRRGDLAFTISTSGKAPGLARLLREKVEALFGAEWAGRTNQIAAARVAWRAEGVAPEIVSRRTRDLVAREGWL